MATFSGFPPAAMQFLFDLAGNNNRDWFEAHKDDYTRLVRDPALAFISTLGERLKTLSPGLRYDTSTNGSGSLMRIYRDTRFSADKTPYKTNVGIIFWEGGVKKMEGASFYFHMEPGSVMMHAGIYMFPKPMLDAYREAVLHEKRGAALDEAAAAVRAAGDYSIGGEHYKRVPKGLPAEHPRADWLRYNGLTATAPPLSLDVVESAALVDACFEHCRAMRPIQAWLADLVGQMPQPE